MKQKFLAILLFFSLLITGCSFDSTADVQDEQSTTEKKVNVAADKEQTSPSESKNDDEGGSTVSKPSEQKPEGSAVEKPIASDKSDESNEPGNEGGSALSKNPESNEQEQQSGEPAVEKETKPEQPSFTLFGDDMIMTVILVVLIVVILVLSWLVYDRHKMKNKLNNLNQNPPRPDTPPPQNVDNPAQTIVTNLNQSPINEQLTIRVDNLRHIGARKEQQDHFCVSNIGDKQAISEKGLMAVVADGMGGLEGGALISRLVTDTFLDSYNNQLSFEPASFLYNTAESSERAVEDYINQTGINGGSTLVAVIVKGSQMNYISVGDSHIYLLRDNQLTLINKEHSFGALLKEKADRGEIDPREPYTNPKRNALTAYIGMGSFNIVDKNVQPISLKAGDKVLLCSDGVYNALGDDALIVAMTGDASTAIRRIQADILAQNIPTQDNFTAIILECIKA